MFSKYEQTAKKINEEYKHIYKKMVKQLQKQLNKPQKWKTPQPQNIISE